MVLADTCIWIDLLRKRKSPAVAALKMLLEAEEMVLAPVILQEILQGARSPAALARLRERFSALPMLMPTLAVYALAGELYACCRWQGVTIRSPHDCLIAALAIEHDTPLLHEDRDFERIAEIEPGLRLWTPADVP